MHISQFHLYEKYICLNTNMSMTSSHFAQRLTLDIWLVFRCDVPAVVDHQLFCILFSATVAELRFVFCFYFSRLSEVMSYQVSRCFALIFSFKTIRSRQIFIDGVKTFSQRVGSSPCTEWKKKKLYIAQAAWLVTLAISFAFISLIDFNWPMQMELKMIFPFDTQIISVKAFRMSDTV